MKCLVTGGSGFIGSHVVDKLIECGHDVMTFDLNLTEWPTRCKQFLCSILSLEDLRDAMRDVDTVFHLAAVADVNEVIKDPIYAENINTRGTMYVLEAAKQADVDRVIYGSTTWVYGDTKEHFVHENTPIPPPSHIYTATKLAGEYYCRAYAELYGLNYTILRYGIPYGPRAREGAVIPTFVKKALAGEPIRIAGDGSQFRQFVYVEDLARGNVLAMEGGQLNSVYNLDGAKKITIKEIAEAVQRHIGDVEIQYTEGRAGDFGGKEIISTAAWLDCGWIPEVEFDEGLRLYIEWYKQCGDNENGK